MKGKRLSLDGLSLFYSKNDTGNFRVGISVGKKIANAVGRNRLKRQIRAGIMKVLHEHSCGYDLVFVARPGLAAADHERIFNAVEKLLRRTVLNAPAPEGTVS